MDSARNQEELRVVFDTYVLLSSTLWDGSAAQKILFKLIRKGTRIFLSEAIISEYLRVVKRDFEYSDDEADALVEKILGFATLVNPDKRVAIVKEDETDNRIIECALAADATHILTYDKHLLRLEEYEGIIFIVPEKLGSG